MSIVGECTLTISGDDIDFLMNEIKLPINFDILSFGLNE